MTDCRRSNDKKRIGKIVALTRLGEKRAAEVRALEAKCREHDGTEAIAELDNELNYSRRLRSFFLLYGKEGLEGFLNVFCPDGVCAEITAFTAPEFRRHGIFNALVSAAREELEKNGIENILFAAEPVSKEAATVAKRLGVNLKYSELLMGLEDGRKYGASDAVVCKEITDIDGYEVGDREFVFTSEGAEFGYACAYVSGKTAFIHHVEVYEEYRGRGLGKALMNELIAVLKKEDSKREIKLQVTSTNLPAVHIYRELGFEIKSQRDYYS